MLRKNVMVEGQWLEFDMKRDLQGFLCSFGDLKIYARHINNYGIYSSECIDMMQKKLWTGT